MEEILYLGSVGWAYHRDENLIRSITLMSRNIDQVVYPIVESDDTFRTSPLIFDFFEQPVVFRYNQEGPQLINYIKNNVLAKSSGVLVSLGGYAVNIDYLRREAQGHTSYLKAIISEVKASGLPAIYALSDNPPASDLDIIRQLLAIPESDPLATYDYSQPGSLKQILLALFKISG